MKMKKWAAIEEAEGKIRLTQCFQLIAQIMICCISKGRLSGPS